MGVAPAVGIGLLVTFFIVYACTYPVIKFILKMTRQNRTFERSTLKPRKHRKKLIKRRKKLKEQEIEQISAFVSGIIIVFLILIWLVAPRNTASAIWIALTIIGVLFGLLTFVLNAQESKANHGRYYIQLESNRVPPARDDLYQRLLTRTNNDESLADRLIAYERQHMPNANYDELCKSAIERLERDNR